MHTDSTLSPGQARNGFPALFGWVLGSALQLQQVDLLAWARLRGFVLLALVGYTVAVEKRNRFQLDVLKQEMGR